MTYKTFTDRDKIKELMPGELEAADDQGMAVLGVLQQFGDVDASAALVEAKDHFHPNAELHRSSVLFKEGVQWLVVDRAQSS